MLTQIMFTRRGPNGHLALGNVVIDKACLGVKNAYGRGHALKSKPKTQENKKRSSSAGSTKQKNYPPSSVIFAAKYKSRPGNGCTVCRKPLLVGQLIHNCGTAKKAIWTHAKCEILS